ncbi:hypothetical protein TNIN_253331 [Trichonephila inaurata madagascariensis]|uniref:Uncharacterized protein n=1 Tax=Trichonephila inaurata madagascariensis TaxID=2747483 RepID=A0A8X7BVZ6_9ARAC|nr:hypothetical protein TNIN_253331 [Trichonephila inaurata madagascariensis]
MEKKYPSDWLAGKKFVQGMMQHGEARRKLNHGVLKKLRTHIGNFRLMSSNKEPDSASCLRKGPKESESISSGQMNLFLNSDLLKTFLAFGHENFNVQIIR